MKKGTSIFLHAQVRKLRPEILSNLPKVTGILSGRVWIQSQVVKLQSRIPTFSLPWPLSRNKIVCGAPHTVLGAAPLTAGRDTAMTRLSTVTAK